MRSAHVLHSTGQSLLGAFKHTVAGVFVASADLLKCGVSAACDLRDVATQVVLGVADQWGHPLVSCRGLDWSSIGKERVTGGACGGGTANMEREVCCSDQLWQQKITSSSWLSL